METPNVHSFFLPFFKYTIREELADLFFYRYQDDDCFEVLINCNDFFYWASADAEEVTADNVDDLKQAVADCRKVNPAYRFYGPDLFAARTRQLRPQGAQYSNIPEDLWFLFNEAGPEREVDFGNPYDIGEYRRGTPPAAEEEE